MDRCEDCGRRLDRPASQHCDSSNSHTIPDKAQVAVEMIEADLTDRSGIDNEWDSIDADTLDEIRDKWASLIRGVYE